MLNHRLAALLVLLAAVIVPMTYHWFMVEPGISWIRPYVLWTLVTIATWLWQRRREVL